MKHKNVFSKRKSAVLFFTIVFLAMGGYCVATKAQNAQTASTLENLTGQEVTKENYTQLVTNGEKPSSMKEALFNGQAKNMFLLYNKGTGKFLTFGGYWGASATLSDSPCPFWLQSRNEKEETQSSCYLRYPENEGENRNAEKKIKTYTNKEKDFPASPTTKSFYFGSQEGANRSNAIYKSIQIVKSDGTTKTDIQIKKTDDSSDGAYHTISDATPFNPNGKKFKSDALDVDFDNGDKLVVKVNLSKCNNDKENILSIGTNIEKWLSTGDNMIHVYFTKNSKTFNIDRTWGESYNKKETTINNLQEDITITLTKDALTITSVEDYGYSVPYTNGKEGTLAKFECDKDGNYVIDTDGKLKLTDDATGKAYYASNANIYAYTYSDLPNDKYPSLFISRNIHSTEDGVGPFLAYATIRYSTYTNDNGLSEKMAGIYTDKPICSTGENSKKYYPEYARWQFIPTGTTGEYRLALHMNVNLETGLGYAEVNNPSLTKEATYYMTASDGYIKGSTTAIKDNDKQHYLYSTIDGSGNRTYIDNFSDRYEMVKMTETPEQSGDYATWKLITARDYLFMLNSQQSALKETIDLSAVLADPDFSRHNDGLKNWQIDQTLNSSNVYNDAKLRIGYDGNYKTDLSATGYHYGSNETWNFNDDINRGRTNNNFCANHSRYMCATVQNGGYGRMYQSITVDSPGWYIVRCQGLTTINAYLYAMVQEGNAKTANEFKCNLRKIDDEYLRTKLQILDAKDAYWPYDQASPMYNAAVDMNDEHVQPNHVKESTSQVLFFVESATPSAPATITFGVNVPQQTTYETGTNGTRTYSKDFTAFDSFRLLYGGQEKNEPYLILNENDENLDYLDQTIHKYKSHGDIHKRLLLHRTFTKDCWNTIMLPVGLTQDQFKGAFGENAQIAELSTLTESQIRFKTVSNSTTVDAPDGTSYDYWLKPMTPYLIKIIDEGYEAPKITDEYTAYLFNCADNGMTYQTKTIGGTENAYYSIEDITMIEGEGFAKTIDDGNFNHWDFKGMTLSNIDNTESTYSYVIKGQETNTDVYGGKMTAYGMLTRNYTKDATSGKNTLLEGRAPMADAYIMTANKDTNKPVLKYKTGGGASKGFRCWFRYTTESSAAKPQFALFIDGISEPTSIEDIMNNDEGITPAEKFAHGIYSLNGQKVGDSEAAWNYLPKGIYIVNGKKVIK